MLNSMFISAIGYQARVITSGVLMCFIAALSVAIIVLVLLQKGSGDGVSAVTGNRGFGNDSEVGAGKKNLRITTIVLGCVLAVLAIIFFVFVPTAQV